MGNKKKYFQNKIFCKICALASQHVKLRQVLMCLDMLLSGSYKCDYANAWNKMFFSCFGSKIAHSRLQVCWKSWCMNELYRIFLNFSIVLCSLSFLQQLNRIIKKICFAQGMPKLRTLTFALCTMAASWDFCPKSMLEKSIF